MGIYINRGNAAFRQYTNGEYVDKTAMIAYINTTVDTATKTVCGVKPYIKIGYTDSLERYKEWIELRISLLDEYFGYNPENTMTDIIIQKVYTDEYSIFDASGRKRTMPTKGMNIYKYNNGTVKKIFIN